MTIATKEPARSAGRAGGRNKRSAAAQAARRGQEEASSAQFPKKVLRSFLISVGIGAVLILLFSIGAYFLPDPDPMIHPFAYAAAGLTALIGGIVAGKIHGSAPAVCGLVNGSLLVALMLLLSLFFRSFSSGYSAWVAALLHAAVPLLSFLGAVIGVRRAR